MKFSVPDMSCGHCTAAIEKSIKARDPGARVACDLDTHTVETQSALSAADLAAAIAAAGYEAAPI